MAPTMTPQSAATEHTKAAVSISKLKSPPLADQPAFHGHGHMSPTGNDTFDQALSRYTLFETKSRFYITASSSVNHRVLKIDRMTPEVLSVTEDSAVYDVRQLDQLLRMVDDGNKSAGGLEKVLDFHGIVGFVRFTAGYYLILCTKRSVVGLLGGHYIYHCDETLLLTLSNKADRTAEETRLLNIFQQVDLSKNFYFSYSYDLTNTLQVNLTRPTAYPIYNTRFMWNYHLLAPAFCLSEDGPDVDDCSKRCSNWVLPIVHGFVDQAKVPVLGRTIYTTLIARRSRHHAGTRYLKRGVNDHGHVANEVETEQIVSEPLTTGFAYAPVQPLHARGYANYTSFVQIRGSIPLTWVQDNTNLSPRPPIEISIVDPFFSAAAKHFSDLLDRYGAPIVVLNLIKAKEPVARESKLLAAYGECIRYLNQFLPPEPEKRIRYIAWDMAQATKTKSQDVIGVLEDIAEESIQMTKFFHGGPKPGEESNLQMQRGICRTNCIDCLDRTNAAQFSIGKKAFGHQLHALGVIETPDLGFDSDAVDMLTEMYHDHGDTLAFQYTGSALVNRMDTYRRTKTRQWSSHSRDILENVRRYYANSMLDADKQAAMDLFLGVNPEFRERPPTRRHYKNWFDPAALETPALPKQIRLFAPSYSIWVDYYKPHLLSQFQRLYTFTMNSTSKSGARSGLTNYSPFESRVQSKTSRRSSKPAHDMSGLQNELVKPAKSASTLSQVPVSTNADAHPLEGLVTELLNPSVSDAKRDEYEWYTHYQTTELLSSTDTAEEQDLQLYAQNAAISHGQPVTTTDQALYERYIMGGFHTAQTKATSGIAESISRTEMSDSDE